MRPRHRTSAVWAAAAAAVIYSLVSPACGQTRLCENYTPTLDGGECTANDSVCEFRLEVDYKLTMVKDGANGLFVDNYAIVSKLNTLSEEELKDVVVGDGMSPYRLVTVVNGTMPGPCLKFFTNQSVKLYVVNNLPSESLSIHWHGLDMFKNSYMDGVGFVSQCPIQPGQTFIYTVSARHPGSYWYHSHLGAQRSMGILGPLVVLDPHVEAVPERVMVLQDWNHDFTSDRVELGTFKLENGQVVRKPPTKSLDGAQFSGYPFHSGLINGRGRYYKSTSPTVNIQTKTPLEVFEVEKDMEYRFRVVGAGVIYPFRVSVEGHRIAVVASDGHDFRPVAAESFVINPGERYDFILTTNHTVSNYMILAETLEVNEKVRHVAEAVLHYAGASPALTRMRQNPYLPSNGAARGCQPSASCAVVNCPFSYYHMDENTYCVHMGDLKTQAPQDKAPDSSDINQIFLNFAFPGHTSAPPSINGVEFLRPPVAAILHPKSIPDRCHDCEADKVCHCTHTVKLIRNRVHQLVLLGMGSGEGFAHPVHIHGYSFYVVKMGYPVYDVTTGKETGNNQDVECVDLFCNVARWRNQSWEPGDVTGLNLDDPIRKDTIIVPTGGYVVLRLKADNPGMWFVHCHIELHHLGGMALILDGSQGLSPPPVGFPDCGNFPRTLGDSTSKANDGRMYQTWDIAVAGIVCAILGILKGV